MNTIPRYILILLANIYLLGSVYGTHNRAGEITYKQIGPLTIEMTITTYTKASSTAADRDSLEVNWGDGSQQVVFRDNTKTRFDANDIKINYYIATHTYPGVATYTVSFLDPNRVGGILNVNYPNSIDIPFFLSTTFTLLDQQFQGFNNSVVLLQPPLDIGCVNKLFVHNPNAYDVDGDSLAYELTAPLQAIGTAVPEYKFPDEIGPPSNNDFTINATTGEIRWNSPKVQGEYNIAIKIKEYRNGKLINVVLRDMQVLIRACENEPPTISELADLCVIAGEKIVLNIDINDPNTNQKVKFSATGGPFTVENPAVIYGPKYFTPVKFSATLEWQTDCNHISDQYYQIVFRAADNFYADSTGLATLKTLKIKVVGPPPTNLDAKSENNSIRLEWDEPYICEVTKNNYFQAFSVWRKEASTNFVPDTCNPGLTGSPYQKIAFKSLTKANNKYYFIDKNAERGKTYCYRVQAEFAKLTSTGNPYNRVESLPSNEACIVMMRDVPMITKASVIQTSTSTGEIHLRWTKPLADQIDTIQNPGPYEYIIYRADDGVSFNEIFNYSIPFWGSPIDTNYYDKGINTQDKQFTYYIQLLSNGIDIAQSAKASSIYLSTVATDKKVKLSWVSATPWANLKYTIFLQNPLNGSFDSIGTTNNTFYEHENLNNDSIYCYKIKAEGSYSFENIEDPIYNDSQITCQKPRDNVPSCPPKITVENICSQLGNDIDPDKLYNTISWVNYSTLCPDLAVDIHSFNIYYAETINDPLQKISSQNVSEGYVKLHYPENGLLGCYAVTAVDNQGNESVLSNKICVDNCPFYVLPNTFTPNRDGKNDTFRPRKNLFISEVDFKVYNQWGNLVWETNNPALLWDGLGSNGQPLADGTYYYTCIVFEKRVEGVKQAEKSLSGLIHIIKN